MEVRRRHIVWMFQFLTLCPETCSLCKELISAVQMVKAHSLHGVWLKRICKTRLRLTSFTLLVGKVFTVGRKKCAWAFFAQWSAILNFWTGHLRALCRVAHFPPVRAIVTEAETIQASRELQCSCSCLQPKKPYRSSPRNGVAKALVIWGHRRAVREGRLSKRISLCWWG